MYIAIFLSCKENKETESGYYLCSFKMINSISICIKISIIFYLTEMAHIKSKYFSSTIDLYSLIKRVYRGLAMHTCNLNCMVDAEEL